MSDKRIRRNRCDPVPPPGRSSYGKSPSVIHLSMVPLLTPIYSAASDIVKARFLDVFSNILDLIFEQM